MKKDRFLPESDPKPVFNLKFIVKNCNTIYGVLMVHDERDYIVLGNQLISYFVVESILGSMYFGSVALLCQYTVK